MDQAQALDILRTLRRERAEVAQAEAAARRRCSSLNKLIEGYIELFPDLAEHSDGGPALVIIGGADDDRPTGQDAVLRVMESIDWRGRYWTVTGMTEELIARGWGPRTTRSADPATAVRTSMVRAAEANPDRIYKGRGEHGIVYFYRHDDMPPPRFHGEDAQLQHDEDLVVEGAGSVASSLAEQLAVAQNGQAHLGRLHPVSTGTPPNHSDKDEERF